MGVHCVTYLFDAIAWVLVIAPNRPLPFGPSANPRKFDVVRSPSIATPNGIIGYRASLKIELTLGE